MEKLKDVIEIQVPMYEQEIREKKKEI